MRVFQMKELGFYPVVCNTEQNGKKKKCDLLLNRYLRAFDKIQHLILLKTLT
jgi:hypothetical protein